MRLVGNHRIAPLLQADAVLDGLQHKGKGLDGDDDDRLRILQGLGQLLRLGTIADLAIDPPHHPVGVLKLVDGFLQLIVQNGAVGDHDHRMELLLPCRCIERGKLMRGPGDGVGLAGAGAMLDQVFMARPLAPGGDQQPVDHIPLMVAGEDQGLFFRFFAPPVLHLFDLQVDIAGQDVE